MNVNDFSNPTDQPQDLLQAIMDRQKELMNKYHHIELKSGLMQTEDCPVDIHGKYGQARLKDFSWRATEELMEALEAYRAGDQIHFHEELIDALHFMMEQHILIDFRSTSYCDFIIFKNCSPIILPPLELYFDQCGDIRGIKIIVCEEQAVFVGMINIVESFGLAMNCLKNKPWKQTHMLTDVGRFKALMAQAFFDYIRLMKYLGFTPLDIYNLYFRKSEVNKFRQKSKY